MVEKMAEIQHLQEDYNMDFGAEESNNLLDSSNLAALKKMLELQLQAMVIPVVKRIVGQVMENMVRKVVKEELERAQERFFTREKWKSVDEGDATRPRQLELQFLEQVPDLVYTGQVIRGGGGGNHLMVELVDPLTRSRVSSGPEASAKVELMVLYKDGDVDGQFKQEESEDMGKPVLTRDHVKLKNGIAVLDDIKFKHKAKWTKSCRVVLMARANVNGIVVKEAETEAFHVRDWRTNLYRKRYPPSLSDEVFRLKDISRGSPRHKRLLDAKVHTVAEFLRLLNMNPHRLKQILKVSAEKYKVIIDHAKTCSIGENVYMYNAIRCGREASAIFNVVGCLRGLLYVDKYVPVDKLSEDEKVDACNTMASAFLDLDNAESIENEASIIAHFVPQSSNVASTSSSPRTENAAGRNVFPRTEEVPTFEDEQLIENIQLPSTENAGLSNFSPHIYAPEFENVENIEGENEISILVPALGSSNAMDAADTSSNFEIWKIDGSDNASAGTVSRHLSPVHSFGRDPFIFLTQNMDILGHGIDCPIYPTSVSEDFGEQLQLFMEEHPDKRAASGDKQMMTGNHHVLPSSSVARRRWKMAAIGVVALDMQARKKMRLK